MMRPNLCEMAYLSLIAVESSIDLFLNGFVRNSFKKTIVVLTITEIIKKIGFNKCIFLPYKLVFKMILKWLFKMKLITVLLKELVGN